MTRSHKRTSMGSSRILERYNKCIAAGEESFEGDLSLMCVLSIKVPIQKSLETYLIILVYIYIYIYIYKEKERDQHILKGTKTRRKIVAMAWIDNQMVYDLTP